MKSTVKKSTLDTMARHAELVDAGVLGAERPRDEPKHLRAELLAEHAELELLIEQLRESVAEGDSKALVEPWRRFEKGLVEHLEVEERDLFPAYRECAPSETHAFELAHAAIREIVDDLAIRIELHTVRAEELEKLLSALRSHRRAEEVAFYRWAEGTGSTVDALVGNGH